MKFKKLIGGDLPFSGNDVRWGVESFWQTKNWQNQFEYMETSLNQERAWGYYWLVALHLSPKNQLVICYDKFSDLNHASTDAPWVILGYNRLFHQHKLKLMVDTRFQTDRPKREIQSTIQLQLFFH